VKVNVYIDGFNLYYGCLKGTPYKWLNLLALCQIILPSDQINDIKYFTARVKARPHDPDQAVRQQTYFRALKTLPNLSIIEGHYLSSSVSMRLTNIIPGQNPYVFVDKSEEKGSDVNLAVHLVNDAHLKKFETAVIISNDSDLLEALLIVKNQLKLPVGVLCPHKKPSRQLLNNATFFKYIRISDLLPSQFSPSLVDTNGTFHKPVTW